MNKAIEKAIEGGYPISQIEWHGCSEGITHDIEQLALLDPLFWQALGKALGWDKRREETALRCEIDLKWFDREAIPPITTVIERENRRTKVKYRIEKAVAQAETEAWEFEWHRFIDHLISGGNAESFFNDLLK